jgi:hypothetical protein
MSAVAQASRNALHHAQNMTYDKPARAAGIAFSRRTLPMPGVALCWVQQSTARYPFMATYHPAKVARNRNAVTQQVLTFELGDRLIGAQVATFSTDPQRLTATVEAA